MINKNKNIKSLPVKICFLKDDVKKSSQQQPPQKLSLTFLSSYIQQDRQEQKPLDRENLYLAPHSLKSTTHYQQRNKITPQDLSLTQPDISTPNRHFESQHRQIIYATENVNPRQTSTYQKWIQVRNPKRSMTDQKRYLNNLLGENWADQNKNSIPRWMHQNKKKTIKRRFDTFQEQGRKQGNEEMLKTHFECFLQNIKGKPQTVEKPEDPKVVLTKVDERLSQKKFPFQDQIALFENSARNRSKSGNTSLMYAKKPRTVNSTRKSHHSQFDSIAARVGFTEIPNFEWFRVNKNAKFKLRKV